MTCAVFPKEVENRGRIERCANTALWPARFLGKGWDYNCAGSMKQSCTYIGGEHFITKAAYTFTVLPIKAVSAVVLLLPGLAIGTALKTLSMCSKSARTHVECSTTHHKHELVTGKRLYKPQVFFRYEMKYDSSSIGQLANHALKPVRFWLAGRTAILSEGQSSVLTSTLGLYCWLLALFCF